MNMKNKKNVQNESYRHHYIPQFIIRNFATDMMGFWTVRYYDKKRKKFFNMPTEEIFMYNDLYRDEINNPEDPVKIEKDFAKYEGEISKTFKDKILNAQDDIVLTIEEHDSLLLFLALMQFRSKNVLKQYGKDVNEQTMAFFKEFNLEGDLVNLWKKNLGYLANCRSLSDVLANSNIDNPFKAFMARDTFGLAGRYLVFVDRRGKEDFFLSDSYPLTHNGIADSGMQIPLMTYFPISPDRMIISVCRGVELTPITARIFDKSFFARPYPSADGKTLKFHIRKMYERDIADMNDTMFELATEGIAIIDEDRFLAKNRKA